MHGRTRLVCSTFGLILFWRPISFFAFLILGAYASLGMAQSTGTFNLTGDLSVGRSFHTATLLANGKVLIAGGAGVSVAELYDPNTGVFALTGAMSTPLYVSSATLLNDGRVLIVGIKRASTAPRTSQSCMNRSLVRSPIPEARSPVRLGVGLSCFMTAECWSPVARQIATPG